MDKSRDDHWTGCEEHVLLRQIRKLVCDELDVANKKQNSKEIERIAQETHYRLQDLRNGNDGTGDGDSRLKAMSFARQRELHRALQDITRSKLMGIAAATREK